MAELIAFPVPGGDTPAACFVSDSELINGLFPGGESLDHQVRFGDDVWDLAGHPSWKSKAGGQTRIDFSRFDARWRDAAKELALLQLNPALAAERAPDEPMAAAWPTIQEPIAPVTAQGNVKMLGHALSVVDRNAITGFDTDDWERLVVLLVQPADTSEKQSGATLSAATGRGRAQQLIALWQATQITGRKNLLGPRPPFDGKIVSELFVRKAKRNAVRPHEAVGQALGFVAWFFDHVAEDVVNHVEWWASNTSDEGLLSERDRFGAMLDLCARTADANDGVLPGSTNVNGGLTLAAAPLGRLLGIFDADDAYLAGRWAKSQLGDSVEYSLDASPCPVPITVLSRSDGHQVPWVNRLLPLKSELDIWQRRLVYYAMYYIAATVMLRDSQLAVLPFDPLKVEELTRPDGTSYTRYVLTAFKTKNRHVDVKTAVVVNARIAHIIELLHRLQKALGYEPRRSAETGLPYLFDYRLVTPYGRKPRAGARDTVHLDSAFLDLLKSGASELHERGVIARDLAGVNLNMREVRITCAQAYAIREHGQALAAAYGQWDTAAVAGGYIGDVYRLITPLEPEQTEEEVQRDTGRRVARLANARDSLTGKGLSRLDRALEASESDLSNPRPLTSARLRALGRRHANISQGPLSLCVFQPEGALCGGQGQADFRLCAPGECRNSVMSRPDRARYELMRRQQLAIGSPRSITAAQDMDERNPAIAQEFQGMDDKELQDLVADHVADYIQAALEDRV